MCISSATSARRWRNIIVGFARPPTVTTHSVTYPRRLRFLLLAVGTMKECTSSPHGICTIGFVVLFSPIFNLEAHLVVYSSNRCRHQDLIFNYKNGKRSLSSRVRRNKVTFDQPGHCNNIHTGTVPLYIPLGVSLYLLFFPIYGAVKKDNICY